jgi:hypothetical protein
MGRRIISSASLGLGILIATAGVASAHECFNASRSEQGNDSAAAHSQTWVSIGTLEELFSEPPDPSLPALSPDQVEWAVSAAMAAGAPNTITVFAGTHTLAAGTPAMARQASNSHGVDYLTAWFPTLIDIYIAALDQ